MIFKNLKKIELISLPPEQSFRGTVEIFKTRFFGDDVKVGEEEVFQTHLGRWFLVDGGEDIPHYDMHAAMNCLLARTGINLFGKIPPGPEIIRHEHNYTYRNSGEGGLH